MTTTAHAFAAPSADAPFAPFSFERRDLLADDVAIDILFCGVCHSDLHTARGEWGSVNYPCVPGHEIVGRVSAVGSDVTKFAVGDLAGVGCMVDSCQPLRVLCTEGEEQYCETTAFTGTYNAPDTRLWRLKTPLAATRTISWSRRSSYCASRARRQANLAAVAPLLCAGITTYSPLHHWKVGPGQKVGVVGLGGSGPHGR